MNRIIVCIKPVPDPKHWDKISMDPVTGTLIREGIPNTINPLDKHAIEAALAIKESRGGEVVLLSMAPLSAKKTLVEALAMGADRAVLLSDRAFAGSDSLATARILEAGCRQIGPFDMVLMGNMSIDGSTAQVCSQLAEFLQLPNAMHVIGLRWGGDGDLVITQKVEQGYVELKGSLPIVISVRKELNKPRYTSFVGILAAESKEVKILSNEDLKLPPHQIGLEGSPTRMAGVEIKRFQRAGERLGGSPEEIVSLLVDRVRKVGVL
jgi:electron transfer flavoprotein beta subunit